MKRHFSILLDLSREYAFDRRAFNGIAAVANARDDIRLSWKLPVEDWNEATRAREADAVIVARTDPGDRAALESLGLPFVALADTPAMPANGYIVANDESAIGSMAATHFLEAGYRSFAAVARPNVREYFAARIGAFATRVATQGFPCPIGPPFAPSPARLLADGSVAESLWDVRADEWIRQLPRPVAIFAPYDAYAQVAVSACRQAGLRVPDDVAVIGVDDDDTYCMTTSPNLSSVVTPAKRVGEEALMLLIRLFTAKEAPVRRLLFAPSEIVVRGSSSDRAIQDPDLINAVRFIRDHVAESIRVSQVADHVLLSRRTLERRFLSAMGHTVMGEIRRAKVQRARRLLVDSDLPYPEVARRSGLIHQQRMNRLIKLETGMTPGQLRQTVRMESKG